MLELERLDVRVVSGRLGRKGGEDGDESEGGRGANHDRSGYWICASISGSDSFVILTLLSFDHFVIHSTASVKVCDRKNSIGWTPSDEFDTLMQQRRSSSLGFGRSHSLGLGVDDPSRRPFVGGGSAAAYEAARADHYSSLAAQKGRGDESRLSRGAAAAWW